MNIAIYIYNQAEVLDFSGPFEVFNTANRLSEQQAAFNTFLIAERKQTVTARAGFNVLPDYDFSAHPEIDVLIVVGGVHTEEMNKTNVLRWIHNTSEKSKVTASVCTGAFLLANAGVLDKEQVTTHWEDINDLKQNFPKLTVVENTRWVDQGNIITSGGITAGIDMSLYLVSRLHSETLAQKTARQMEFNWTKNDGEQVK